MATYTDILNQLKTRADALAQRVQEEFDRVEGRPQEPIPEFLKSMTESQWNSLNLAKLAPTVTQEGGRWVFRIGDIDVSDTSRETIQRIANEFLNFRNKIQEGQSFDEVKQGQAQWVTLANELAELTGSEFEGVSRLAANNRLGELTGAGSTFDTLRQTIEDRVARIGQERTASGATGGTMETQFSSSVNEAIANLQSRAQAAGLLPEGQQVDNPLETGISSEEQARLEQQAQERVQGAPAAPTGITPTAGGRSTGTITEEDGRFVVRSSDATRPLFSAPDLDTARTWAIDNNLLIEGDELVNRAVEEVERRAPAPGEERELTSPTVRGGNLFWQDPDTGTPGTIVQPPAPTAPEAPAGGETPPTGETPPAGETPTTPTTPETPEQLSTQTIVDGMLQGVDESVRKLITEMTEQFGTTLDAFQKGQEVNEEELNARFEELKTKNINPYFKQLITNYQTDLLHNLGTLTGQRRLELDAQQTEFENQTRQARATLEASGLSFSGEALRLLGAESAFGQRQLPPGMEQRAAEPLQMTEIPEGQVPESQRLMATSTRARFAEQLRNLAVGAERELGSTQIPEALKLAGFAGPGGEPTAGQFLTGGQIGDVERQKREAELAGLEALRGVQSATQKVNALGQPL